ncbi:MAG: hypothetical protein COX49_02380 [bacterium (Candidatus Stahlbacteria) CG23_combo_of_CG06-09_8_20_14_all_40_9]|nr:MAG: hypothetical protein COX49_02380 [bacterium (Candidatus Stahlbacteria) CG23_combo_of_CG06-09_8_20_14_all_40_9]
MTFFDFFDKLLMGKLHFLPFRDSFKTIENYTPIHICIIHVTLPKFGLGRETHDEIKSDFRNKKQENPQKFNDLLEALTTLYNCSENDIDRLLKNYPDLQKSFQTGAKVDVQ